MKNKHCEKKYTVYSKLRKKNCPEDLGLLTQAVKKVRMTEERKIRSHTTNSFLRNRWLITSYSVSVDQRWSLTQPAVKTNSSNTQITYDKWETSDRSAIVGVQKGSTDQQWYAEQSESIGTPIYFPLLSL